jgi:hypothetical protein
MTLAETVTLFNRPVGQLLEEASKTNRGAVVHAITADRRRVALVLATTDPEVIAAIESVLDPKTRP